MAIPGMMSDSDLTFLLGVNMLMQAGWQPGYPGTGQRFGAAMGGTQQMLSNLQRMKLMEQQAQYNQSTLELKQAESEREAERRKYFAQRIAERGRARGGADPSASRPNLGSSPDFMSGAMPDMVDLLINSPDPDDAYKGYQLAIQWANAMKTADRDPYKTIGPGSTLYDTRSNKPVYTAPKVDGGNDRDNLFGSSLEGRAYDYIAQQYGVNPETIARYHVYSPKVIYGEDGKRYIYTPPTIPGVPRLGEEEISQIPMGARQAVDNIPGPQMPGPAQSGPPGASPGVSQGLPGPAQTPGEQAGAFKQPGVAMTPGGAPGTSLKPEPPKVETLTSGSMKKHVNSALSAIQRVGGILNKAQQEGNTLVEGGTAATGVPGWLLSKGGSYVRQATGNQEFGVNAEELQRQLLTLQATVGPLVLNEKRLAETERQRLMRIVGEIENNAGRMDDVSIRSAMRNLLQFLESHYPDYFTEYFNE